MQAHRLLKGLEKLRATPKLATMATWPGLRWGRRRWKKSSCCRSAGDNRKGSRPSLSEADYAALIAAAHRALNAPLIVVWDNLNTHRSQKVRQFTEAREEWLTIIHLPAYAPDLNAVEGAWANMKSSLGNHAATTLEELEAMVRCRLRSIQRRPDLINAFLGQTGLTLKPPPP